MKDFIPFSRPDLSPLEYELVTKALDLNHLQGSGPFINQGESKLKELHGQNSDALLTSSCSDALEMTCHLIDLKPGDEVIVPSYTFSSTANAVIAGGGKIAFADISLKNFCMTATEAENVKSSRTRAIIAVNYAGCGEDLRDLREYSKRNNLVLIEDNAHGISGTNKDGNLGTFGSMSTLSFHATKNITSGEGGALIINDDRFKDDAYILRDKGTNRKQFMSGQADKYTWHGFGSSYGMSDLSAALLVAQLERLDEIQSSRSKVWLEYQSRLRDWAQINGFQIPKIEQQYTSHIFWMLAPNKLNRDGFLNHLRSHAVHGTFHYVPLHSSPMGKKIGSFECPNSEFLGETLVRLPLSSNLNSSEIDRVIEAVLAFQTFK